MIKRSHLGIGYILWDSLPSHAALIIWHFRYALNAYRAQIIPDCGAES